MPWLPEMTGVLGKATEQIRKLTSFQNFGRHFYKGDRTGMKHLTKEYAIRWINRKLSYLCFISVRRIYYNLAQTIAKLDDLRVFETFNKELLSNEIFIRTLKLLYW